MGDCTNHSDNKWGYSLLGDIIKLAIEDYNTKDKTSKEFITASTFLFKDENVLVNNNPINSMEIYLSSTELSADAIRKTIRRR